MNLLRTPKFLFLAAFATASIACSAETDSSTESVESAQRNDENNENTTPAEPPAPPTIGGIPVAGGTHVGVHGMNLFGSEHLYLSHIPLYSQPHNLQVIVEVKIVSGVQPAQQLFATKNFTVRPQAFSLMDLALGTLRNITGTIYLNNFESGGTPAFSNVKFEATRVIFKNLMSNTMPRNDSLDYIAMGSPTEAFLVHLIDKAPSFDQIVHVQVPAGSVLDAPSLEIGTLVRVNGGLNSASQRLQANDLIDITPVVTTPGVSTDGGSASDASTTPSTDAGAPDPDATVVTPSASLKVVRENACLPGPDFYGTCPSAQ